MSKSKCTKHTSSRPLLAAEMLKKCTPLWRKAHFKCTKHLSVGPLLEVEMSKKCTPLWREAHFEVNMLKTPGVRTTFGEVHAVVARRTFRSKNVQNTRGSDHFWRFRCRFASIHYTTGHYTTLHSSTLHYTTVHSTTLNYTTPHYITLNDTATQITGRQLDR